MEYESGSTSMAIDCVDERLTLIGMSGENIERVYMKKLEIFPYMIGMLVGGAANFKFHYFGVLIARWNGMSLFFYTYMLIKVQMDCIQRCRSF
ncbi:hypothetical protein Scep_029670 [Stephania cephalantha]|uniref:Uncharacterized protein n=1 Tax=Stephania cephalantha TaxID=152367 RepID=A0AAP0E5S7_9MAGN